MGRRYDIFISYRRDGGSETAKHLRDALVDQGYRVFYDIESMRSGPFNTELFNVIEDAEDFILILPPHALDRCESADDWVRLEIEHAQQCGKNIVPVILRDFVFPEKLPESIDFIRYQNGLAANTDYWDAFVDRLLEFLKSRPRIPKGKRWIPLIAAAIVLCGLGVLGFRHFSSYPHNQRQRNTVSSAINYFVQNLAIYNNSAQTYLKGLDEMTQYADQNTRDTLTDTREKMLLRKQSMKKDLEKLYQLPDASRTAIAGSPLDLGEMDAFFLAMKELMNGYIDNMDYLRDNIIGNEMISEEDQKAYIAIMREICNLDAEYTFYCLNEALLPVTEESALSDLKTQHLPEISSIYSKGLYWTMDKDTLIGKQNAVYTSYKHQMSLLEEWVEKHEKELEAEAFDVLIGQLMFQIENGAPNTEELQAALDRLEQKKQRLQELKEQHIELDRQLEEAHERLREQIKPLDTDDEWTLWGKGKRFITLGMLEDAATCFDLFVKRCAPEYQFCGIQAGRFARNAAKLGISGGVVVFMYEEGKPAQAVEIGDIIYAVEGTPVNNITDYEKKLPEESTAAIQVLRFTDEGYELLDSAIDNSLGMIGLMGLTDESEGT